MRIVLGAAGAGFGLAAVWLFTLRGAGWPAWAAAAFSGALSLALMTSAARGGVGRYSRWIFLIGKP